MEEDVKEEDVMEEDVKEEEEEEGLAGTWTKGWKIFRRVSLSMPIPVSFTEKRTSTCSFPFKSPPRRSPTFTSSST